MPNIVQQSVGPLGAHAPSGAPGDQNGIYVAASNGNTVTITRAQIIAHYISENGLPAVKKANTVIWIKQQIASGLGSDMVPQASITSLDFSAADGSASDFEVTS